MSSTPSPDTLLSQFSNPLNTLLLLPISYLLLTLLYPPIPRSRNPPPTSYTQAYSHLPAKHPEVLLFKSYTPRELSVYDGVNPQGKGRIMLAIGGTVFDVSAGKGFYGPGGPYGNFAGRDASRGMAKQSFDEEMLTPIDQPIDPLDDLTPSEIENMNGWIGHFSGKYIMVGELVEERSAS